MWTELSRLDHHRLQIAPPDSRENPKFVEQNSNLNIALQQKIGVRHYRELRHRQQILAGDFVWRIVVQRMKSSRAVAGRIGRMIVMKPVRIRFFSFIGSLIALVHSVPLPR